MINLFVCVFFFSFADDPGGGGGGGKKEVKNNQRVRSVGPKKSMNSIEIVPIMQTVSSSSSASSPSSSAIDASKSARPSATIDAYQVQNSSNLFNNNQSSTSSCSSSDLKYLHKKFKRIASASVDIDASTAEAAAPSPVNSPPEATTVTTAIATDRSPRFNGYLGKSVPPALTNGDIAMVHKSELLFQQKQHSHGRLSSSAASKNHHRDHNVVTPQPSSIPYANNSDINASCDFSRKKFSANSNANSTGKPTLSSSSSAAAEDGSGSAAATANTPGRYVCPFCQLNCTKPSVLRKHIRAHTNERPYPCVPCGFAFKTKSNLHKHYR